METPFQVHAKPNTDIWRKPPSHFLENAPILNSTTVSLESLTYASVSFHAHYTCPFDQAGLAIILRHPNSSSTKWIKLGIEYFEDEPRLSVSCCDNWADWSAASLSAEIVKAVTSGEQSLTFTVEKKEGALWVYSVSDNGKKVALREITWIYGLGDLKGWSAEVGAMAARPNTDATSTLDVTFDSFTVR